MRGMWLYALPFALAALNPVGADAQGRAQNNNASPYAVLAPDEGYDADSYSGLFKPHGRERSDAVRLAATRRCDGGVSQNIGRATFNKCMRARGWAFAQPAPATDDSSPSLDISSPPIDNSSVNAAIEMTNQEAATDASVAASQQQFIDGMAAAQQSMNNATFNQP